MFSWSRPSAGHSSATTASSPLISISRDEHLSSYLSHPVLKPSTRKVSSDDTIFDTVFQTTDGFALILRVYIPVDPGRAPTMSLHGVRASHNWLDIRMRVIGYAPISSDQTWKSSNKKLGDSVYEVIHHLQLTPPSILEITDPNLRRLQQNLRGPTTTTPTTTRTPESTNSAPTSSPSTYERPSPIANNSNDSNFGQKQGNVRTAEPKDYEVDALIPSIPPSFPGMNVMTLSELKELIDDESVLERYIDHTMEVVTLKELKHSIEAANETASKSNLANEEKLEVLRSELQFLEQEIKSKVDRYRELDSKRLMMTRPPDLQDTIRELNIAKKEAFRESEEMAEDWIESGGVDINDFVKRFMDVRLLYHTRAAKAERLAMSM